MDGYESREAVTSWHAQGPVTRIYKRTKTGGSWRQDEIANYRLWWPWFDPVEMDLGDGVRMLIAPHQEQPEADRARWRATQVGYGLRNGLVSATRTKYGVRVPAALTHPAVVEALQAWEAVQSLR